MRWTSWMFASMWLAASAAAIVGVIVTGQPECLWAMAAPVFVSFLSIIEKI